MLIIAALENMKSFAAADRVFRRSSGFSLVEVVVAAAVLAIVFMGAMQGFLFANKRAVASRLRTSARAVVQRNIEQALTQKFTISVTPAILAITSPTGISYDDDGGGDNLVSICTEDGTGIATVRGTLTRAVTAVTNPNGADIRRVTFTLSYTEGGKSRSYTATTVRARD
jgi:prepilin-type N-terminal cleavage/methylation domain-containing protein